MIAYIFEIQNQNFLPLFQNLSLGVTEDITVMRNRIQQVHAINIIEDEDE